MSAKNPTLKQLKERIKQISFSDGFITPVIKRMVIKEQNLKAKLKEVEIINIPHSDNDYDPIAWMINLEMAHPLFAPPQHAKTCEYALILMVNRVINVFVFELKSSLQNEGGSRLKFIQEKIVNSVDRIAYLLPLYIPDESFDEVRVTFWGIVCYNHDNITKISESDAERKTEFYKILKDTDFSQGRMRIDNTLTQRNRMEIAFFQNPNPTTSSMTIDFQGFYTKRIGNTDLRCLH